MNKEDRLKAAEAYAEYGFIKNTDEFDDIKSAFLAGAEAEAESKWISVNERNPEPTPENYKKHFLVFLDLCKSSTIGYYHENKWITYGSFTGSVTHWQPLPSPPLNKQ